MLSTEKWDNWGKAALLFPFTALTCDEIEFLDKMCPVNSDNLWIKSTLFDLSSVPGSHM